MSGQRPAAVLPLVTGVDLHALVQIDIGELAEQLAPLVAELKDAAASL
ncbi:MAG TPA: hypothetical protein VFD90_18125 [Gaiellales bacterium]|nr:hypothetical protein [Gaiellales bacterium]